MHLTRLAGTLEMLNVDAPAKNYSFREETFDKSMNCSSLHHHHHTRLVRSRD